MPHFIDSDIQHILVESPPHITHLAGGGGILQESGHACPVGPVFGYITRGILLRAGAIERGLSGASQNQSRILVRHQGQEGTVKGGTREKEARFPNWGIALQSLFPVRVLGLF